jgi:hypothetical protein
MWEEAEARSIQLSQLWTAFLNLTYEKLPDLISDEQPKLANGDEASAPTITTSLLYHAKIYVFAEKCCRQAALFWMS